MHITDFIEEAESEVSVEITKKTDLGEIEKTAELLEALAEEDTLMDDIVKLAVLQDVAGLYKKSNSKIKFAKKGLRSAEKRLRVNLIDQEAVNLRLQSQKIQQQTERITKNLENAIDPASGNIKSSVSIGGRLSDAIVPALVGSGVAVLGTSAYFHKKKEQKSG